jgi:hypothetical protein
MCLKSQGAELRLGVNTDLTVQGHHYVPHWEQEKAGDTFTHNAQYANSNTHLNLRKLKKIPRNCFEVLSVCLPHQCYILYMCLVCYLHNYENLEILQTGVCVWGWEAYSNLIWCERVDNKFLLEPMGVLVPGSAYTKPFARRPIDSSRNFPAHMSAESSSNISPNPLEVIFEVSKP